MSETPHDAEALKRGPRGHRGEVADQILAAARESFARYGFAGTTFSAVGRAAGVDTKLVHYYFADKAELLERSSSMPEEFLEAARRAMSGPIEARGEAIVRNLLAAWSEPQRALALRAVLLIAAHESSAMDRVRSYFVSALLPAAGAGLPAAERSTRAALMSTQLLGLAFARFVFEIDQVVAVSDEQLVRSVGATLQRYLTDPLS